MIPTAEDFEVRLHDLFSRAQVKGLSFIDIVSGDLHRQIGGYPAKDGDHRMPVCCEVMKRLMKNNDKILHEPLKGKGATLQIRYFLPR